MNDQFFYDALKKGLDNANSRKNYEHRLNSLIRKLKEHGVAEDAPKDKLVAHVLTHPRKYMPVLVKAYNEQGATIKNVFTMVLALFKYANLKCRYEGPYVKWKRFHESYAAKEQEHYNSNDPTKKQRNNYISFEEMKEKLEGWKHPHETVASSLQYTLICMYYHIRPKRADFGRIKVYEKDPRRRDINYLVLHEKDAKFVLNNYNKTGAKGEPIVEPVPGELADVITASLARHPRRYLFVGRDGRPFKTSNAYSKFVIHTYKTHFGRGVGVSMLRHIYISERLDMNKLTVKDKDDIAKAMGHSRRQQEQYKLMM